MKRKAAFEINTYVGETRLSSPLLRLMPNIVPKTLPLGSGARSSWQPFTRIGRAKRVGHHELQTPEHPTGGESCGVVWTFPAVRLNTAEDTFRVVPNNGVADEIVLKKAG